MARPLRPGDIALIRSPYRPSPGISLCRAHDTLMEDCTWHGGDGMGLVAQRCENVTLRGSGRASDRTAGAFAREGADYATALQADATHFSNCKGRVLVENCFFEATVDDAINVHSTSLMIESVPEPDTLVCRYMHKQSTGFEVFLPGERLRFIKAATLENGPETVVKEATITDPRHVTIRLTDPVPSNYVRGDAVENADWQPSVVFRNNIARKICARSVLLTTPGKTVIEGNLFDGVSAQVIQLEGDASGWYESGACRDVTIRNNVFRDCSFLSGEGIIQIRPNLKDIKSQKERYHRNIVIEHNRFETPKIPLLRAYSVSNLVWRDNEVVYNDSFPARGNGPFVIDYSENINVDSRSDGRTLSWSDEFNGTSLDTNRWTRIVKGGSAWNRHMSTRADLVEVKDGSLVLWGVANEDKSVDTRPYLTGGVGSKHKGLLGKRGKVEIRAKFEDHQKGAWPALWMCGDKPDAQGRGWPWTGEIDIVERLNGRPYVYHTAHTGWTHVKKHKKNPPNQGKGAIKNGDWNVYGFEITESNLVWSVNGKTTFRYPKTDCGDPDQWPFDREFFFYLDMQLGGSWVGPVDVSTLPVRMWIDWIRVYE